MSDLPTGTVTFLFTDLEGSTRLWEQYPDAMKEALAFHDAILRDAVRVHGGHIVKMTGDGVHAAFSDAARALLAAADAQRVLNEHAWGDVVLRVRMGVHTGHAEARDGDYYGTSVNRAARLMSAANGGQVVVSLAAEELACDELPPDVSLIDLGEQRLRDLARSERMFQLSAPGLAATFPALRSLDAYPSNLPPQVTSFVGREAALCDVAEALQSSRIVSLTGVGGVGKTRLATQVAAEVLPEFADGVWLCELAAAGDAESMTQLVAATLGVSPRPGITLESSVADFLHLKRVLLVLDNCEHLLEAAAHLVDVIVQRCPDARVLITSREGLGVPGEQIWPVRSLVVEGTSGAANDAMMLFADRARAARPGFALDQTNEQAVRDVCRRLDGIPLAIELAAARVTAMSPADIAGLLDERFRLLTGGRRTAVERHQTLRAAVDWSYSLLTPTERTVFDCLGVFAGTFDADSASAVAIGKGIERWDVLDAVSSLVAKSMAVMEEDDDSTRYQLLETLRQYARERLDEAGVADDVRRRHATHYCERAEALGPALHGAGEIAARRQIRADLDDLRAAVFWAADSGTDGELAIRVIASVGIEQTQDQRAGIGAWAIRVADLARQSSPGLRMAALSVAAAQFMMLGDYAAARSFAQDAIVEPLPSDCPVPYSPYYVLQSLEAYEDDPKPRSALHTGPENSLKPRGPTRSRSRCNTAWRRRGRLRQGIPPLRASTPRRPSAGAGRCRTRR